MQTRIPRNCIVDANDVLKTERIGFGGGEPAQ